MQPKLNRFWRFIKDEPGAAVAALLGLICGGLLLIGTVYGLVDHIEHPAPLSAAEKAEKLLCDLRPVCTKYGAVRQQCATAGDFNNCIRVKIGSIAFEPSKQCTDEGEIVNVEPSQVPDRVTCTVDGLIR